MVKLMGSLLILTGGGLLWRTRMLADRRRRRMLVDLAAALGTMSEEIRAARTPMPELLKRQAVSCGEEVRRLLETVAASAAAGTGLTDVWKRGIEGLPLDRPERELLLSLELRGDEEQVCKALSLTAGQLRRRAEEWERRRPEETKRTTVLCFSGAALLVILLI